MDWIDSYCPPFLNGFAQTASYLQVLKRDLIFNEKMRVISVAIQGQHPNSTNLRINIVSDNENRECGLRGNELPGAVYCSWKLFQKVSSSDISVEAPPDQA